MFCCAVWWVLCAKSCDGCLVCCVMDGMYVYLRVQGTAYQPLVSPQQKPPFNSGSLPGDTMMQLSVK